MKKQLIQSIVIACSIFVFAGCQTPQSENAEASTDLLNVGVVSYQDKITNKLMPHDWTFLEADVPILISQLRNSDFSALYVDAEKAICVTSADDIQICYDSESTWSELATEQVSTEQFSQWLLENDPIPGYSMKDLQKRLEEGAEVRHIVFDNQQEIYFVVDEHGVQIELVQPDKIESVLLDGVRLMFTSATQKYQLSNNMIDHFTDMLKEMGITEEKEAVLEWDGVIEHLTENKVSFYFYEPV